jgi:hypothetical protein
MTRCRPVRPLTGGMTSVNIDMTEIVPATSVIAGGATFAASTTLSILILGFVLPAETGARRKQ